jgi:Uma2 family endonuclease
MASSPRTRQPATLEEFLREPGIDEHPYKEYIDGRIEVKASPQTKHSVLTLRLSSALVGYAEPRGLGFAFPELRCTFAGRSIIADIVFLLAEHIVTDELGVVIDEILRPPDIHVEIVSPEQFVSRLRRKLVHSTANGCPLGFLIDPERNEIEVFRPSSEPVCLADDGILDGDPVLPGFQLPVSEIFGWLVFRKPGAVQPPDQGAKSE